MFCPKCGTQNPDNGKFCRQCGTDLATVSDALIGKISGKNEGFGMMQPIKPMQLWDKKGKPVHWEGAITKLFSGLAFLIISIVLSVTPMGRGWWFWMLIPAFGALGSGIAQIVQLKKNERFAPAAFAGQNTQNVFNSAASKAVLPSPSEHLNNIQTLIYSGRKIEAIKAYRETYGTGLKEAKEAVELLERRQTSTIPQNYVEPPHGSIYDTGELTAPPSIVESTTRHLEMNSEGETMTLPEK